MAENVNDLIHDFFTTYPKRTYPKGQILIFGDENPEHIYYLVEGRVRKYDVSYRGDEMIVNVFKPGAFFPMSWALDQVPNHFFYKTETDTELHVIPPDDAVKFLQANPEVTYDLVRRVYRGIEGLLGRMVHLMSGTAKSRLLYELIIECRRFGAHEQDGTYHLESNEVDLAARSGLSRETVSREMHKLKAKGWVSLAKGEIIVHDLGALTAALGTET